MKVNLIKWSLLALTVAVCLTGFMAETNHENKSISFASSKPHLSKKRQKLMRSVLVPNNFSGTATVFRNGKVIASYAGGYANNSKKISNRASTMYEIDSIQKMVTATLIMKEVQDHKIKLTDHLSKFYPDVQGSNSITIRQMLDMTSGLSMNGPVGPTTLKTDTQIIKSDIYRAKFTSSMHGKWNYQPVNYNLMAGILEKVSGHSYRKLVNNEIIKPLRLKHTAFAYQLPKNKQSAAGYNTQKEHTSMNTYNSPAGNNLAFEHDELGTGQLFMSTRDLYTVASSILQGKIISKENVNRLFQPGSTSTYGGGYYISKAMNASNGAGYGFESTLRISPDGQRAVILLSNYQIKNMQIKNLANQINPMVF